MRQKSKYPMSSHGSANCHSIPAITADVIQWMRHSGPRTLQEVEVLRKGMRKNVMVSMLFERQIHETQTRRKLWHIKGHASTLILASEKHIKFFRKKLQERRKRLEIDVEIRESEERERQRLRELAAEIEADADGASESSQGVAPNELPW